MNILICKSLSSANKNHDDRISLTDILKQSDFLTLHCPLTSETNNLIKYAELSMMKKTAIILNLARGGIINEADLAKILLEKKIQAAAIDVMSQEPPPIDHPFLNPKLDNLLITPHIAWASFQAQQELIDQTVKNICSDANPERI